jgi:hypothetical protein
VIQDLSRLNRSFNLNNAPLMRHSFLPTTEIAVSSIASRAWLASSPAGKACAIETVPITMAQDAPGFPFPVLRLAVQSLRHLRDQRADSVPRGFDLPNGQRSYP